MDLCANFDVYRFVDMISPRPLLMVVEEKADTKYFGEEAIRPAKKPNELFSFKGKSHVDLYDDLRVTARKLVDFFARTLVDTEPNRL
jgi:fermentation-respiration switch protein FrsA (DUF1100 family)